MIKICISFFSGRNFGEILRVIDSLQLTAAKKVATPVDWEPGASCMVQPSVFLRSVLFKNVLHLFSSSTDTQRQFLISYNNSTAMYKFLKTLHPGGIRTRYPYFQFFIERWLARF
jgi:hypothetical protein